MVVQGKDLRMKAAPSSRRLVDHGRADGGGRADYQCRPLELGHHEVLPLASRCRDFLRDIFRPGKKRKCRQHFATFASASLKPEQHVATCRDICPNRVKSTRHAPDR